MLQNAYFLAKSVPIQLKTSNILPKSCQKLATALRIVTPLRGVSCFMISIRTPLDTCSERIGFLPRLPGTESGQTLQGSFSAVSKPNFASKYSLENSRRDLHNALLCTALESIVEKWGKKDLISKFCLKTADFFAVFFQNFANFARILLNFRQI